MYRCSLIYIHTYINGSNHTNAGTDGLYANVPFVTLPGKRTLARMGASFAEGTICVCVYVYVCVCVCVHICMKVCIYMHVCLFVYVYIHYIHARVHT